MTTPQTEGALFGKKVPNGYKVDYDASGFCALCHVEVIEFEGSRNGLPMPAPLIDKKDGRVIGVKTLSNFRSAVFLLNDGSSMQVTMCDDCSLNMKPSDTGVLMESIINGWAIQTYSFLHYKEQWTKEKRDAYMERYSKKTIEGRLDRPWGLTDGVLMPAPNQKKIKKELAGDLAEHIKNQALEIRKLEGKG